MKEDAPLGEAYPITPAHKPSPGGTSDAGMLSSLFGFSGNSAKARIPGVEGVAGMLRGEREVRMIPCDSETLGRRGTNVADVGPTSPQCLV